ncbi:hypothetical protein H9X96_12235 [Pedobacter sp. N36a]|uniref:hypothetical protein n=1 Tax=Pedobacter sp. N36a TaxID=2767996 RepID=UPI001656DBD1|nr:hypothetical protein [Pedobacter sp. N36a]MBC8986549.1 hypothetical protein [Pedobacter sp. N36a]
MRYWKLIFFGIAVILVISWTIYCEIKYHYLISYDGVIIERQQIPPKNMPDLVVKGTKEIFPLWKWKGIDFDSVKLGDSISKKKYELNSHYFKKLDDGRYIKIKLKYWTQ